MFYCTVALQCIFASCISSLLLCSVHIDTLSSSSSSLKWIRESSIRNKGWAPEEEMHKQILQWFLFALLPSSSSHLISLNKSVKVDVHKRNAPIMTLQIQKCKFVSDLYVCCLAPLQGRTSPIRTFLFSTFEKVFQLWKLITEIFLTEQMQNSCLQTRLQRSKPRLETLVRDFGKSNPIQIKF